MEIGTATKEEMGEKRRREEEKEENETVTFDRRCEGLVSVEACDGSKEHCHTSLPRTSTICKFLKTDSKPTTWRAQLCYQNTHRQLQVKNIPGSRLLDGENDTQVCAREQVPTVFLQSQICLWNSGAVDIDRNQLPSASLASGCEWGHAVHWSAGLHHLFQKKRLHWNLYKSLTPQECWWSSLLPRDLRPHGWNLPATSFPTWNDIWSFPQKVLTLGSSPLISLSPLNNKAWGFAKSLFWGLTSSLAITCCPWIL